MNPFQTVRALYIEAILEMGDVPLRRFSPADVQALKIYRFSNDTKSVAGPSLSGAEDFAVVKNLVAGVVAAAEAIVDQRSDHDVDRLRDEMLSFQEHRSGSVVPRPITEDTDAYKNMLMRLIGVPQLKGLNNGLSDRNFMAVLGKREHERLLQKPVAASNPINTYLQLLPLSHLPHMKPCVDGMVTKKREKLPAKSRKSIKRYTDDLQQSIPKLFNATNGWACPPFSGLQKFSHETLRDTASILIENNMISGGGPSCLPKTLSDDSCKNLLEDIKKYGVFKLLDPTLPEHCSGESVTVESDITGEDTSVEVTFEKEQSTAEFRVNYTDDDKAKISETQFTTESKVHFDNISVNEHDVESRTFRFNITCHAVLKGKCTQMYSVCAKGLDGDGKPTQLEVNALDACFQELDPNGDIEFRAAALVPHNHVRVSSLTMSSLDRFVGRSLTQRDMETQDDIEDRNESLYRNSFVKAKAVSFLHASPGQEISGDDSDRITILVKLAFKAVIHRRT